jgi:RimJ/RimL family protein N-acetyltransferase
MASYVTWLLGQADQDQAVPFAQRLRGSGRVVGCTRFMELRWWRGRAEPDEVEIGGTWLAADVQRTGTNTEAKLLLLAHAFNEWHVDRVALAADERNARSRTAIARLGATFEGVLRKHRPSKAPGEIGTARDTALFSITADEWPAVRAALAGRLGLR